MATINHEEVPMTTTAPDVAKALRVALAMKNMKRFELAEKVGVSVNHMSRLATGTVPLQGELMNKVAAALDMRVSEFVALGEE